MLKVNAGVSDERDISMSNNIEGAAACLGASWRVVGASWDVLERLGASWGRLGGVLGTSWGRLGGVLGASWGVVRYRS